MKFKARLLWLLLVVAGVAPPVAAQSVQAGLGSYVLTPRHPDQPMPKAPHRVDGLRGTAAQTNQWYSSLIFNATPEVIYVQPLAIKATREGFEFSLPKKQVKPSVRQDVEIHYPHQAHVTIAPTGFSLGQAKLAKATDWSIDIAMGNGPDQMTATVAHGWPYVALETTAKELRLMLPAPGQRLFAEDDAKSLVLEVGGTTYAFFGPTGVLWRQHAANEWRAQLPATASRLTSAALPDAKAETVALFRRHAYATPVDTRVAWQYDAAASQVKTSFVASTQTWEGVDHGPLLGLYPHHWHNNASVENRLGPTYDTVRGPIRLLPAARFETVRPYQGFVPFWPKVEAHPRLNELADIMRADKRTARRMMLQQGEGPYWQGKGIQRNMKLVDVLEQQGDVQGAKEVQALVMRRMEDWFAGRAPRGYFHYDKELGAIAGYPDEFFSVAQINDHHFTFGYWIRTAAELALRDPTWAAKDRWGAMVELLVSDIATAERGRADFPFLRTFDLYEGHSWASGIGLGPYGNNQESSSEAVNAWVGLILWGELTGQTALRDLGVFLFTSEVQAINYYWFDVHKLVLAPEYKNVEVSMLFGGMYAHNTWWTDEPRQIKGINLLPITTASTYLGKYPDYVRLNLEALGPETALYERVGKRPVNPPPRDIWQDVFAKYQALAEPAQALAAWDRWGSVEVGESRTHTLHFLMSLDAMGSPDSSITADTPLYAVFRDGAGRRTYLAYNAAAEAKLVRFSDGKTIQVPPRSLGQMR